MMDISTLTEQFIKSHLKRSELHTDPIEQFNQWMQDRLHHPTNEPTAMSLATASLSGEVSIRTVLLKYIEHNSFVFFTNYHSEKAAQISENANVALLFQWLDLERQIKIKGYAEKISAAQSLKYFLSRPRNSQINAWASPQSSTIKTRSFLLKQAQRVKQKYKNKTIPLPDFWGGYRVTAQQIEFWQGRNNRLHDRFLYTLNQDNNWQIKRLAP